MENRDEIIVFTDGSSRGNPGPGGWGTVVVEGDAVLELGGREVNTTNNRMEMTALLEALLSIGTTSKTIVVYIDSSYVVKGMSSWIIGWKKNNWKTADKRDVSNKDLWEKLDEAGEGRKIEWKLVEGHVGIIGNERCDEIATEFADNKPPTLFDGCIDQYRLDILNVSSEKVAKKSKDRSKLKAHSYLSFSGGEFMKHKTWAECKEWVNGKSNAKFRKAISEEDEAAIMKEWGVK